MGGTSAWGGTDLPKALGSYATLNMSPRGPAYGNYFLKEQAIDQVMNAINSNPEQYMGSRETLLNLLQQGNKFVAQGYVMRVNDEGVMIGYDTDFKNELLPGDTLIVTDNGLLPEFAAFTVVEALSADRAWVITAQDWAYGQGLLPEQGWKTDGTILVIRRPIFSPPFLHNPDAYMTDDSEVGATMLAFMNATAEGPAFTGGSAMLDTMNADESFAKTLTEDQLGLDTFANTAAAKAELHKSIEAAEKGLLAAENFIALADPAAIESSIEQFVEPLVAQLIAQRDADLLSIQRGFTIANGFFNTNILDRVTEVQNKYAVQIAALTADAGLRVMTLLNTQAVQLIDALLRFQNGPLRDRVMAQELRLKAMEVGSRIFLAAQSESLRQYSFMYGAAQDSVKRDYANDVALWGMREDLIRFSAELQGAYLGTVNAGIGKGVDAMGVTKQVLGMAIATAGAAAAFVPGAQLAAGDVAATGAAMMK